MIEDIHKVIEEIENDVVYFTNIGFDYLAEKFKRDLNIIKSLADNKG